MIYIDEYHLELNLKYYKFYYLKYFDLYFKLYNLKFSKFTKKLELLDLSLMNIIPKEIQYFTNLKELYLCNNKIEIIPEEIKNLTNLTLLYLKINRIKIIPTEIQYLTNLKNLNLSDNMIEIIPTEIQYLTNLNFLILYKNFIEIIPTEIQYLTNLKQLYLYYNNIEIIPEEIKYLTNLKILNLIYNKIKIIPLEIQYLTNLITLIISNNNIKNIPNEIRYLTNLKELNFSNNQVTTIPNSIIYCRNLRYFNYNNNEIIDISPIITRFLNRIRDLDDLQIYNDSQNIHNHSIQESLFNSIVNIINQNYIINNDEIINNIIQDTILTEKTKNLLIEYCENKDIHSRTQLTFEELLCNVWTLINTLNSKDEIKTILNTEMHDSECKCFTGRISRLVNCLNGFTDLVKINISDNQQIGNIIIIIREKLLSENNYSIEKHKELVIIELTERGFNEEIINEWIDFI
jgi:Leucine-rich repeat (LRR) protein